MEHRRTGGHTGVHPRVLPLQVADCQGSIRHDSPARGQLSAFSSPADHRLGIPRCAAVQRHSAAGWVTCCGRRFAGKCWKANHHKHCTCCCGAEEIERLTEVSCCITFVSRADGQRIFTGVWSTGRYSARCPPPSDFGPRVASHVTRGESDVIAIFDVQRSRMKRQPRGSCGEEERLEISGVVEWTGGWLAVGQSTDLVHCLTWRHQNKFRCGPRRLLREILLSPSRRWAWKTNVVWQNLLRKSFDVILKYNLHVPRVSTVDVHFYSTERWRFWLQAEVHRRLVLTVDNQLDLFPCRSQDVRSLALVQPGVIHPGLVNLQLATKHRWPPCRKRAVDSGPHHRGRGVTAGGALHRGSLALVHRQGWRSDDDVRRGEGLPGVSFGSPLTWRACIAFLALSSFLASRSHDASLASRSGRSHDASRSRFTRPASLPSSTRSARRTGRALDADSTVSSTRLVQSAQDFLKLLLNGVRLVHGRRRVTPDSSCLASWLNFVVLCLSRRILGQRGLVFRDSCQSKHVSRYGHSLQERT